MTSAGYASGDLRQNRNKGSLLTINHTSINIFGFFVYYACYFTRKHTNVRCWSLLLKAIFGWTLSLIVIYVYLVRNIRRGIGTGREGVGIDQSKKKTQQDNINTQEGMWTCAYNLTLRGFSNFQAIDGYTCQCDHCNEQGIQHKRQIPQYR